MKIGDLVEVLIELRKDVPVRSLRDEALIEACNLLDKLPRLEEATTYAPLSNTLV